jgi:tetratricopeptide (TPR) repeat protein
MVSQMVRVVACTLGIVGLLVLVHPSSAQQPKDSKEPPKQSPDEQKAKEAFLAGKADEALKALQAAAKTNPLLDPPKATMARWCVETQQGQQARVLIEQAAAEDPAHPQVMLTNASFALAEGRLTDTILSCSEALRHADNPRWDSDRKKTYQREARLGLVAAFDARGDNASVKSHLLALLDADSKNAQLRQRLARANFLLTRYEEAFNDLNTAFKDDPTLDPPELVMAQLWTGKNDFGKAEEWYAKAVAAHAKSAKVHRGFAGYLLDRGRSDLGKAHLAAAQKIEPNARETKALAGLFARYAKDYTSATQIFEELAREHPSFGFATANLALVLAESGDTNGKRRASELAESYAKQNQRSAEARAIYAYCLFKAGRTADSEKIARSAVGLEALTPDAAFFVARILADRGANEEAQKIIKAAVESKGAFVYRKDGEALLAELDKKVPPKK